MTADFENMSINREFSMTIEVKGIPVTAFVMLFLMFKHWGIAN